MYERQPCRLPLPSGRAKQLLSNIFANNYNNMIWCRCVCHILPNLYDVQRAHLFFQANPLMGGPAKTNGAGGGVEYEWKYIFAEIMIWPRSNFSLFRSSGRQEGDPGGNIIPCFRPNLKRFTKKYLNLINFLFYKTFICWPVNI